MNIKAKQFFFNIKIYQKILLRATLKIQENSAHSGELRRKLEISIAKIGLEIDESSLYTLQYAKDQRLVSSD